MSQTMTSFSVTNPVQILNHPLNSSQTKQQYSFSKSTRFDKDKSYCLEAFYNSSNGKTKRSASIGYGSKSDFTKSNVMSPSPDSYSFRSRFERSVSASRGKSFGTARDKITESGYITKGILKNPGPGDYPHKSYIKFEGYSIRPKTTNLYNPVFLDGKTTYQSNPGPGKYQLKDMITKFGTQTVSNFRSSGATTFNPPTSQRFEKIRTAAPGPGAYKPKNDLDQSGHYVLSQNQGYGTRAFPSQQRKSFTDIQAKESFTPGPGNYRIPSEFGNYDHIDMYRTRGSFGDTKTSTYRPTTAKN